MQAGTQGLPGRDRLRGSRSLQEVCLRPDNEQSAVTGSWTAYSAAGCHSRKAQCRLGIGDGHQQVVPASNYSESANQNR